MPVIDRAARDGLTRALTDFRDKYKLADDEPLHLWVPHDTEDAAVLGIWDGIVAYFRDPCRWGGQDFWVEGGLRRQYGCGRFGDLNLVNRCILFLSSDREYQWPLVAWWEFRTARKWNWSWLRFEDDWTVWDRDFAMGRDFEIWPFTELDEYVQARVEKAHIDETR